MYSAAARQAPGRVTTDSTFAMSLPRGGNIRRSSLWIRVAAPAAGADVRPVEAGGLQPARSPRSTLGIARCVRWMRFVPTCRYGRARARRARPAAGPLTYSASLPQFVRDRQRKPRACREPLAEIDEPVATVFSAVRSSTLCVVINGRLANPHREKLRLEPWLSRCPSP